MHVWRGVATADSDKIVNPANNHTYQRIDTPMAWADAKANCEKIGAHLATVTSDSENQFLVDNLLPSTFWTSNVHCWLGATDAESEGTWKWVTGEKWDFTAWGCVSTWCEPNGYTSENCLMYSYVGYINSINHDKQFGEHSCSLNFLSLCEWETTPTPTPIPTSGQYTLTVTKSGNGSGDVTASTGTLSWSGNTGTASYNSGTSVVLTAAPASGSSFTGWSGDCNGTMPTCTLVMSANKNVTATFSSGPGTQYTLKVTKAGTGTCSVTASPDTLSWAGNDGSASYNSGASVILTATPASGSSFIGWSGDCNGAMPTCTLTMSANKNVTATCATGGNGHNALKYDFDGDGKRDLLWRNSATGDVYIWLMSGKSITGGNYATQNLSLDWDIIAVDDFNGDGKSDILLQNSRTGDIVMWLMDGVKIASNDFVLRGMPSQWQIKTTGDFDGDGKADMIWQSTSSGDIYVWLMDGTKIIGGDFIIRGMPSLWQMR
ncbi:C-type lectin domain protein [Candidatus Magnetobacterium bavaricum]|uniref:C-type lectin domain protein n=1 Tax=Candidatus Magnetobacterium bavaricum TaxID=29290 RepID=A0A0F3GN04_9BACT|nr:C-type lectin domain protein [Candidatus Magnetobacterium bavaricum]